MKHHRIVVIGHSCSGKSTLARKISHSLHIPYFDLDEYRWCENWTQRSDCAFRSDIDQITQQERWVLAGNYTSVISDIAWPRATALIFIDIPLYRLVLNCIRRTARRMYYKIPCSGNNYETIGRLLSKNSLLLFIVRTYRHKRELFKQYMHNPPYDHLYTMHLQGDDDCDSFIETLR